MNPVPASIAQAQALALHRACSALWLATLSLMTAFLQTRAPAHRHLLARRIAANFQTLSTQDCFAPTARTSFARLARRWDRQAQQLAPQPAAAPGALEALAGWLAQR